MSITEENAKAKEEAIKRISESADAVLKPKQPEAPKPPEAPPGKPKEGVDRGEAGKTWKQTFE